MKFILLFISTVFLISKIDSQQLVPVIQSNHSSSIQFYSINYEKNLLLTADEKEVILWNVNTGMQLRHIPSTCTIRGATLCSNGNEVAIITYKYGTCATLHVFNSYTGDEIYSLSFSNKNAWGSISYATLDELIYDKKHNRVAIRAFDKMSIVDIRERKITHQFSLESYSNKFCFTDNPNQFIVTKNNNNSLAVAIIDALGNELNTSIISSSAEVVKLNNNKEQNLFYVLDSKAVLHIINPKLEIIDTVISDSIKTLTTHSPIDFNISNDGKKIVLPFHTTQYLYNISAKKWIDNNWKFIHSNCKIVFADEDADKAIVISDKSFEMIYTDNGNRIYYAQNKSKGNNNISFSPSENFISSYSTGSLSTSSLILNLQTGMQFNDDEMDFAIFKWISDSIILCGLTPKYDYNQGEFVKTVQVKNIYSGEVYHSISISKITGDIEFAAISNDLKKIVLLTLENAYIYSGKNFKTQFSFKFKKYNRATNAYFTPDSKKLILPTDFIRIYDFEKNKWTIVKDTATLGFHEICISPNGKEIWYQHYKDFPKENSLQIVNTKSAIMVYNLETNELSVKKTFDNDLISSLALHPTDDVYAIGFFNGTIQLRNRTNNNLIFETKEHYSNVDKIGFTNKNNWLYSMGQDKIIKFRNYSTKESLFYLTALYKNREQGFALLTPENYYLIPAVLINELHFVKGINAYTFSQFDLLLNRPDKVLEKIGLTDNSLLQLHQKAYKRRLQNAGYTSEQLPNFEFLNPLIIENKSEIPLNTSQPVIDVTFSTQEAKENIKGLMIYINGQKVKELKGYENKWKTKIDLSIGNNIIETAYMIRNGTESLREQFKIEYKPIVPTKKTTYYIGIAVSNYQDSTMNLKYAVKDVVDIAHKFKLKDSTTKTYLFLNEVVTKNNLDSIKSILAKTSINDKVVLSLSGHGMLDTANNFYFGAWDIDFNNPQAKGISFNNINHLLENIPARDKLILIDACHSGEVEKDNTSFVTSNDSSIEHNIKTYTNRSVTLKNKKKKNKTNTIQIMEQYFSNISSSDGINIISAAAGEEYAFESAEWNNGVFSYSFMNGIFEKKADLNLDGEINQLEIRKYMQKNVLQLTKGKQRPTARSLNILNNWTF
jgi:hypothetical protein